MLFTVIAIVLFVSFVSIAAIRDIQQEKANNKKLSIPPINQIGLSDKELEDAKKAREARWPIIAKLPAKTFSPKIKANVPAKLSTEVTANQSTTPDNSSDIIVQGIIINDVLTSEPAHSHDQACVQTSHNASHDSGASISHSHSNHSNDGGSSYSHDSGSSSSYDSGSSSSSYDGGSSGGGFDGGGSF